MFFILLKLCQLFILSNFFDGIFSKFHLHSIFSSSYNFLVLFSDAFALFSFFIFIFLYYQIQIGIFAARLGSHTLARPLRLSLYCFFLQIFLILFVFLSIYSIFLPLTFSPLFFLELFAFFHVFYLNFSLFE